jgi:hypothetical protein
MFMLFPVRLDLDEKEDGDGGGNDGESRGTCFRGFGRRLKLATTSGGE